MDTLVGSFLILHLEPSEGCGFDDTSSVLRGNERCLQDVLDEIEKNLISVLPNLRRATNEYWKWEIGVLFPEGKG